MEKLIRKNISIPEKFEQIALEKGIGFSQATRYGIVALSGITMQKRLSNIERELSTVKEILKELQGNKATFNEGKRTNAQFERGGWTNNRINR